MIRPTSALIVGLFLAGCAREAPPEMAPPDPPRQAVTLGESCALSPAPQGSSPPRRIFVELATLEGDWAAIMGPNVGAAPSAAAPRTFSQALADPRWKAISVRHLMANDGVRQTLPWQAEPPRGSTGCPATERWELSIVPRVVGRSPVTVQAEVQILPAPPLGVAPDTWHVPPGCGARTTVVLHDQQVIVLSGFPASAEAKVGVTTTLTPYVIWEEADLQRLLACKRKLRPANADVARSIPPQTPTP